MSVIHYAQAILATLEPQLQVDGVWGGYTDGAYRRSPPSTKEAVDAVLKTGGFSADALIKRRAEQKKIVVADDIERAIDAAASRAGVSPSIMNKFLVIENPKKNPFAVSGNGSSHGLFQIQQKTWTGVLRNNGLKGPVWAERYDIGANALIAALLIKENANTLRKLGYPEAIDGRALYLAHQQGPVGAVEVAKRATGRWSEGNTSVLKGSRIADNLPKGVPVNAQSFSEYWWRKAGLVMA